MGDKPLKDVENEMVLAQLMIAMAIENEELGFRDEIYCQIAKQVTLNPSIDSTYKGWDLLCLFCLYFPPSKELTEILLLYFAENMKIDEDDKIPLYAKFCLKKLPKIESEGAKGRIPSVEELEGYLGAPFRHTLFGCTLDEIMETQQEFAAEEELPLLLSKLSFKVLELNGHKTEGIFRIPGDADQVAALKIKIENGIYDWEELLDPHVPASLLKLWMRELEQPIIVDDFYDDAIESARNETPEVSVKLIKQLPKLNQKIVKFVVQFLREMARDEFVESTKMSTVNLAMVFAPNFLRCPSPDPQVIFDTQKHQQTFVRHLIECEKFKIKDYAFNLE